MPTALYLFRRLDCLPGNWLCLALLCWLQGSAAAHPFHISSAEVEYDAASGRVQVSLKLQANDLEQALSRGAGRRVNIEQPQAKTEIVSYLGRHFYLSAAEPTDQTIPTDRSRVLWVGQELKGAWLWLYFELELPNHRELTRLTNTVLFDVNQQQINTVTVRHGSLRTTLKLTTAEPSANFEAKWLNRG